MSQMPLFPLSGVLLPHGRMPLQIFEQRYLDLVRDCSRDDRPFGVVWIRRGSEVAERGKASPDLGDYGTTARIVDWDQLPNGLLGITIEGVERFDLHRTEVAADGLVLGEITMRPGPEPAPFSDVWVPLRDVLQSLETHPHVQRMGLDIDHDDPWQVAYTLVQLLPLEEHLKYDLLGINALVELMEELDKLLNQLSGED